MEKNQEIIKCPFCGGDAEVIGRQKFKITCKKCGSSSMKFDFRSDAIASWNKRNSMIDGMKHGHEKPRSHHNEDNRRSHRFNKNKRHK